MKTTHFKNKWNNFVYYLPNQILTDNHIEESLNKFKEELIINNLIDKTNYIYIQFKIKTSENIFRSISYMQRVNILEFYELLLIFKEFWNIKSSDYHQLLVKEINFSYSICPKSITTKKLTKSLKVKTDEIPLLKIGGFNFPSTMDISKWPSKNEKIIFYNDYKQAIIIKPFSKIRYYIKLNDRSIDVEYKLGDKILISFKDETTEEDRYNLNTFIRTIKNTKYYYKDSTLILKQNKRKCNYMTKINRHIKRSDKFIVMDLETREIDKFMSPICLSLYDGKDLRSFYLLDFSNSNDMLEAGIKYIMRRKYSGYRVYLHNFSNFDSIFLLNILCNLSDDIKPIIRNGQFIDLKFKWCKTQNNLSNNNKKVLKNKLSLYFRDSYLLLPSSLDKLSRNFNTDIKKGIFPFNFINKDSINLDYVGPVPELKYFNNLKIEDYISYYQSFIIPKLRIDTSRIKKESLNFCSDMKEESKWDLKKELLKYCEQDVISLYQVINKFSKKIFKLFRLDITKFCTLPSLALAIYRSNFLKDYNIPLIGGQMYNDLKESYTGGAVDVYKPHGYNIFRYDVNSLYPFVMKEFPMPVGEPVYFEGDISQIDKNAYGIFDVDVYTPKDLNIPLLQTKVKTEKGGIRTISGLGSWRGMYNSIEILECIKYGYQFKIHRGYLFERGYIFKEYIDFLYELKVNSKKGYPDYIIAKLLMNSLYGRFGMKPIMEKHEIISESNLSKIMESRDITDLISLKNGKYLISFIDESENLSSNDSYCDFTYLNISVPIASTITAAARIHMSKFKNMKGYTTYYSDTDSIDLNRPLESNSVGSKLGEMKLEHVFDEAIYLAPKVYGGKTSDYEYVKVKGLKNPVSFDELSTLLEKDNKIIINQDKWYKNISIGNIFVKEELYTLIVTENKRKLIYDSKNQLIDTKPLILQNKMIIDNNS
jgi:DNA polymerase type B, organellar and viral